jgi:hypothetical protein
MPRLHVEDYNRKIISNPLSLTEIDTEQSVGLSHEFVLLNDLKECRNLKTFTFIEGTESLRCGYIIKPNHLDLRFCTKLTHLTITLFNQTTFDTIDLTNCVQLTHLSICTDYRIIVIKNINLTKCINLTHVNFNGEINVKDYSSMPDLSKCLKLQSVSCRSSGKYFDINLNPILFPDVIEINGKLSSNLILRLKKNEKEIETRTKEEESESFKLLMDQRFCKLEERLNSVEEENRELRKIIDELTPIKSKYM